MSLQVDDTLRQAYKKIWGGMKGRILIVVSTYPTKMKKLVAGEGCLYSLNLLLPILRAMYTPNLISIDFSQNVLKEDYKSTDFGDNALKEEYKSHNLILFGGPMKNKITEVFMSKEQREKMRLRFFMEGHILRDLKDESFHLEASEEEGELNDYGIATKRRNRNYPEEGKRLYIMAGSRMFATQASTLVLTEITSVEAISEEFGSDDFEIRVERKSIFNPGADPVRITFPERLTNIVFGSSQSVGPEEIALLANPSYAAAPFHLDVSSLLGLIAVLGGFGLLVAGILADISYCLTGGAGCVLIGLVHLMHERIRR